MSPPDLVLIVDAHAITAPVGSVIESIRFEVSEPNVVVLPPTSVAVTRLPLASYP